MKLMLTDNNNSCENIHVIGRYMYQDCSTGKCVKENIVFTRKYRYQENIIKS